MPQILPWLVRTVVPILAGWLITLGVRIGVPIDNATATAAVAAVIAVAYAFAARLFEVYVSPHFGWLLGWARRLIYEKPTVATQAVPPADSSNTATPTAPG